MKINQLIPIWFRKLIPEAIKDLIPGRWRGKPLPIYGIGQPPPQGYLKVTNQPKRALLSYITIPFRLPPNDPRNVMFSNIGIARSIVRVLNELGYIVDIVEYKDTNFVPHRKYNLFIGHGGYNFEPIVYNLYSDTIKIYFSTGIYWKEFNRREAGRFRWIEERCGVRLPYDRWIYRDEEYANRSADAIICIGNEYAKKTYSQFPLVINLNNAAYSDDHYDRIKKDFVSARKNFLFFASGGNVHKGLDLLLEAFVHMNAHLYICQEINPKFYEIYKHELEDYQNIHLVGYVPMRSLQFYELVDKCAFVIYPSCAEGQPGSVVECMHQGLIPIVSRESNIDTKNFGITLSVSSIDEIIKVVRDVSQRPPKWVKEMSRRTREVAIREYSVDAFLRNMKNAIQHIITYKNNQSEKRVYPFFVDEYRKVFTGNKAMVNISKKNDGRFIQSQKGIIKVDKVRWEEAQRYERRTWMEKSGCRLREDRNSEHERHFSNYISIQGRHFNNAIEIGCGPFTNMNHILKHIRCKDITLLDPLINSYLSHPHCTYKHKRLGGWFGKKVHIVAKPIEDFMTNQKFDLVVMINVLEHCFSVSEIFKRILSLTALNGIFVFHDKLIPKEDVKDIIKMVYDAGHPIRISEDVILEFLHKNFKEMFSKRVIIPTAIYKFNSIYFIGQKYEE